jgi:hypothetical protein
VRFNLLLRDFIDTVAGQPRRRLPSRWTRAMVRPKRALFLSSPIGLGHALRDVAIADELRRLQPDLEVDWLTQHPVVVHDDDPRRHHDHEVRCGDVFNDHDHPAEFLRLAQYQR